MRFTNPTAHIHTHMIDEVHFSSRYHAERVEGRLDTIVVSIHDRHAKPSLRSGFRDVLYLAFDDYDRERDGADALMEPFTADQADTLKHWLETYLRAASSYKLLIHCHAGISRSAAIAYWAQRTYELDLKTDYPTYYLNRHVLKTLNPKIEPPQIPADAPMPPRDRSFGPPPLLKPTEPRKLLVVFAHDKESGPWSTKFRHLSHIARRQGARVLSPSYSDLADPDERVQRLLKLELPEHDDLVLVGSSMGGYVSAVAAATLKPRGLFLLAPAIGMSGYAGSPDLPNQTKACIVHGWQDEQIPTDNVIGFAKMARAELHLINAGHRLEDAIPEVGVLFEQFLSSLMSEHFTA
jgi:predicted protein tyrosine phosphatase/predicted alpha/beta-hydrolase family hydrolase